MDTYALNVFAVLNRASAAFDGAAGLFGRVCQWAREPRRCLRAGLQCALEIAQSMDQADYRMRERVVLAVCHPRISAAFLLGRQKIDQLSKFGYPNFCGAAPYDDLINIRVLVALGADVNQLDEHGRTNLHYAARMNEDRNIALLLDLGAQHSLHDCGLLYWAACRGDEEIIRTVIRSGVDVNLPDPDGWTALHYAVDGEYMGAVDVLVNELDAGVDICDKRGVTPLHLAADLENDAIARLLLPHVATRNDAESGLIDYFFRELENAYRPENKNPVDTTYPFSEEERPQSPLHWTQISINWTYVHIAAQNPSLVCFLRVLLEECKAEVNQEDDKCRTPLYLAIEAGNEEGAQVLLEHGAHLGSLALMVNNPLIVRELTAQIRCPLTRFQMEELLRPELDDSAGRLSPFQKNVWLS